MIISMKNLKDVKKVFGSTIKVFLHILLVLTICTSNGQKLMLDKQNLGKPIDSSLFFGKRAKLIKDLTECATLKTDVLDSLSWHQGKRLTWRQYLATLDSVSYQNQVQMLKKCSQIKLYRSRLITRFSSNRFKTVWTDPKPNLPTGFQLPDSLEKNWKQMSSWKKSWAWTPLSTGKILVITPMTEKNLHYLSMMKQVNGKNLRIFSITGELPRRRYD